MPVAAQIDSEAFVSPVAAFDQGYSGIDGVNRLGALTGISFNLGATDPWATYGAGFQTQGQAPQAQGQASSGGYFNAAADALVNIFKSKSDLEIAQAQARSDVAKANAAASGVRPSALEVLTRPSTLLPILGTVAVAGVAYALFKK